MNWKAKLLLLLLLLLSLLLLLLLFLLLRSLWCFVAGRRNFGDFISGYVEPIKARYIGVDTGKDLGECSNLAAVTWGQRAAIGGLPHRCTSPWLQAVHTGAGQCFNCRFGQRLMMSKVLMHRFSHLYLHLVLSFTCFTWKLHDVEAANICSTSA